MPDLLTLRSCFARSKNSTGPRDSAGKRASSANSTKHGLFAKNTPVREEDRPAFLQFSEQIHADLQPQGPTEEFYVDHFIDQCWRLRWCLKLETDLYDWYRTYKNTTGDVGVAFARMPSGGLRSRQRPVCPDEGTVTGDR